MLCNHTSLTFACPLGGGQIFGAVVRIENNGQKPGLEYILRNQNVLTALFDG